MERCRKDSSNPAEQKHVSVVAILGENLDEDPNFDIKTLLSWQQMLEKDMNKENSEYQLCIGIECQGQHGTSNKATR